MGSFSWILSSFITILEILRYRCCCFSLRSLVHNILDDREEIIINKKKKQLDWILDIYSPASINNLRIRIRSYSSFFKLITYQWWCWRWWWWFYKEHTIRVLLSTFLNNNILNLRKSKFSDLIHPNKLITKELEEKKGSYFGLWMYIALLRHQLCLNNSAPITGIDYNKSRR